MSQFSQITINSGSEEIKAILGFISDTAEGKYTAQRPEIINMNFKRLVLPEQDRYLFAEDNDDNLLLGISS